MTPSPTPRLGLALDADIDPIEAFRTNWSRVDQAMPIMWVNPGVVPADAVLYDGAIVGELTTGKVWVAHKNVGGTYDHIWLKYPYTYCAINVTDPFGTGGAYSYRLPLTFSAAWSFNAVAGDLGGSGWVAPVTGIYNITTNLRWANNATGQRGGLYAINSVNQNNETENVVPASAGGIDTTHTIHMNRILTAGDVVATAAFQNSGSTINLYQIFTATLVQVING